VTRDHQYALLSMSDKRLQFSNADAEEACGSNVKVKRTAVTIVALWKFQPRTRTPVFVALEPQETTVEGLLTSLLL
jgi:hypothetical protein